MKKYKSYSTYKPSGVEWLGNIPEHWELRKLKFIADLIMGQSPDSTDYNYEEIGVPFLQGTAEFGTINPNPRLSCGSAKKYAIKDDLLLSVRAPVGEINVADQVYGIGRGLCAIRPRINVFNKTFTRYFLEIGKVELISGATGSIYDAVTVNQVANLQCLIPPLKEQKLIATFLDRETTRIDTLITKKCELINLLEKKRIAIITKAVTKGLNSQRLKKDNRLEWLDKIPEHWTVKRLKFVAQVQSGLTLGKNYTGRNVVTRPYLRVANVQDGFLDLKRITEVFIPLEDIARYELKSGDVLMTEGGDFDKLGRGYIWQGQIEGCLHQNHVFAVRPYPEALNSNYLAALMTSHYGKAYFTSTAQQTTNLATTNRTKLNNFPLPLPDVIEQENILTYIHQEVIKILQIKDKLQQQIDALHKYRQALITAAVTGKIDVREEVKRGTA